MADFAETAAEDLSGPLQVNLSTSKRTYTLAKDLGDAREKAKLLRDT